jgi:hypothetical protein
MATSGEKRWPPVGNYLATNGEKPTAIDSRACLGSSTAQGPPTARKPLPATRPSANEKSVGTLNTFGFAAQ